MEIKKSRIKLKKTTVKQAVEGILGRDEAVIETPKTRQTEHLYPPPVAPSVSQKLHRGEGEEQGREAFINGVKVNVLASDFELHLRSIHGLPLSISQGTRARELGFLGVFVGSPEFETGVLSAFPQRRFVREFERVLRFVRLEEIGVAPGGLKRLNVSDLLSDKELQGLGFEANLVKEMCALGLLKRSVDWEYVDTKQERSVRRSVRYQLSRRGAFSGDQFLVDMEVPGEEIRLRLHLRGKKGKVVEFRPMDYEIGRRIVYKLPIPPRWEARLKFLREHGLDPSQRWLSSALESHPFWHRATAKIERRLWLEASGVNIGVLREVNTWKQVRHEDLLRFGSSEEDIARLVKQGVLRRREMIVDVDGTGSQEKVVFYHFEHSGKYSGIEYLVDDGVLHRDIQKFPQRRGDLLSHDLFVPSAFLKVKTELESHGLKIVSVKNEAQQYREVFDPKTASYMVVDEPRRAFKGKSFADCVILVENEQGAQEEVFVEWGVYEPARMAKKCASWSKTTFVVSTAKGIASYQKHGGFGTHVQFRVL